MTTAAAVLTARRRIASWVRKTPLVRSAWLSERTGSEVYLKLESLQLTGSFKARGAFNATLARLDREKRSDLRLVTASAGNHGRALACAGEALGLPVTVFTAKTAARTKLAAIRRHGADLRAVAENYDETEDLATNFAASTGAAFISPYNDPDVIAGAGTIAMELVEDLPSVDEVIVPVGGGGLISGIAVTLDAVAPSVHVVGVEAQASPVFTTSLSAGRLVRIDVGETIADGLAGNADPGTITFDLIHRFVDRIVLADEPQLRAAIQGLIADEQLIVEGAGAAAVGALVAGQAGRTGRTVVAVVSGSNIDVERLMAVMGREARPDRAPTRSHRPD